MAETAACSVSVKRERKPNFSDREVTVLLELYQQHCHLLQSKFSSVVTQKRKTGIWEDIATGVSACGVAARAAGDVRKKWIDIKRAALKANSASKRPQTGGGPPPPRPWFVDNVLDVLGEETSLVDGIEGRNTTSVILSLILS